MLFENQEGENKMQKAKQFGSNAEMSRSFIQELIDDGLAHRNQ